MTRYADRTNDSPWNANCLIAAEMKDTEHDTDCSDRKLTGTMAAWDREREIWQKAGVSRTHDASSRSKRDVPKAAGTNSSTIELPWDGGLNTERWQKAYQAAVGRDGIETEV